MNPEAGPRYNSPEEEAATAEFNKQPEASEESELDHQQRVAILENLHQEIVSLGYGVSVKAHYEDSDNRESNIVMQVDTYAHGKFDAVLDKYGQLEIRYTTSTENAENGPWRQLVNDSVAIRDAVAWASERPVIFTFNGKEMDLPEAQTPGPKQPDQPEPPKPWPPKDQNVHYDSQRGMWHGSPKS